MDWSGAVLHMEVSEVDSASLGWDNYTAETAEGLCQGKIRAHREGSRTVEEYTCGITQRGITTHRHLAQHKGWPWANTRVLDLASGAPPRLTAEGAGGTSTGFAAGNWTEKQLKRTYPVRRREWRSKRDWHRAVFQCYRPSKASTREDTGSTQRL